MVEEPSYLSSLELPVTTFSELRNGPMCWCKEDKSEHETYKTHHKIGWASEYEAERMKMVSAIF